MAVYAACPWPISSRGEEAAVDPPHVGGVMARLEAENRGDERAASWRRGRRGLSVGGAVLLIVLSGPWHERFGLAQIRGGDELAVRDAVGDGMHAFHAGEFNRAFDDLTQAIQTGSNDPRSYYFRGLAALRIGRLAEAEADFAAGAEREIDFGGMERVSRSLERVQGHDRLRLERYRARARLAAITRDREAYSRRYSTIDEAAPVVRRRRRPEDVPAELVAPGAGRDEGEPVRTMVEEPTPTEDDAAPPSRKPAAAEDPDALFDDDPKPSRKPRAEADDDSFGKDLGSDRGSMKDTDTTFEEDAPPKPRASRAEKPEDDDTETEDPAGT